MSDVTVPLVERNIKSLTGNRVFYPDRAKDSFVQRYLRGWDSSPDGWPALRPS